ncbi:MAG: hypothetical protein US86_C0010G0019 [Candidatus Daviesbacteria bacterium GW2011_GWA2_38_24]|uniref:Uncharacterized protein n=1 Tax=Candidatus Daviesbacteria bacterium GW2011_GWA2_38_24 TaxID=1618422 RepID=A0A0G0JR17_9BACT|nr:MAG: hypothetical protein US86_C0010G0019 [Candidatus Daviesbacteria bacterium GW2011_GWA2_38_24]KKQ78241.1 MAG: hypothetical protein UT01_C0077G0002 [Candidatus Daviesbacteria bacterium GW2011_GWA1_38_7]
MEVQGNNLQEFNIIEPSRNKNWPLILKRYWLVMTLILVSLIVGIVWLFFKNYDGKNSRQSLNLKSTKQNTESKNTNSGLYYQNHPTLYAIKLEYDPSNETTTERATGTVQADPPYKLSSQPKSDPDFFVYKVEVLDSNKIIESGWYQLLKKEILTSKNTYLFTINVTYSPKKFIRITLPDKTAIWSGKMS